MSKSTFSEHGLVAYQVKRNHKICPDPWVGVKRSNFHFQNMAMLHIKLKGIRNAATW